MNILDWLQNIDAGILLFIQEHMRIEAFNGFWKAITFLGNGGWFWLALGLLLLIPQKTRKIGLTALFSILIGFLITNVVLKNWIARPRPYVTVSSIYPLISKPGEFSFPSGHSAAAFSAAGVFVKTLPKRFGIPLFLFAVVIALSRLYVGVHYPSDVLCGVISGLLISYAARFCVDKVWRQPESGTA